MLVAALAFHVRGAGLAQAPAVRALRDRATFLVDMGERSLCSPVSRLLPIGVGRGGILLTIVVAVADTVATHAGLAGVLFAVDKHLGNEEGSEAVGSKVDMGGFGPETGAISDSLRGPVDSWQRS